MKSPGTYTFFIASAVVIVLTFIFSLLWEELGYGNNVTSLFISVLIALVLSIAGVVRGLVEVKKKKGSQVWLGIMGNALIIVALISLVLYGLDNMV
ncbi:MAG: hypothetical protein KGY60_00530 [Bacteroidales bacterium]|nr:hypothetical protein [Bacteroidales bacterium]